MQRDWTDGGPAEQAGGWECYLVAEVSNPVAGQSSLTPVARATLPQRACSDFTKSANCGWDRAPGVAPCLLRLPATSGARSACETSLKSWASTSLGDAAGAKAPYQ